MARVGFAGGTYSPVAGTADAERSVNVFAETMEAEGSKSRLIMRDRPGMKKFASIGATAILGSFSCQPSGSPIDRVFAVVQNGLAQTLVEVDQNGNPINTWNLLPPTSTVSFAQNQTQLAICTGGQIWVLNLVTNTISGPISPNGNTISLIDQCDGFGIAVNQNSNGFNISAVEDFTSWPGLSAAVLELPDNIISLKVMQKTVWFQGRKSSVPYYDFGYFPVPFAAVQGVLIEDGAVSTFGRAIVDNTLFWWDANERGQGICRRMDGYTPQRVSNHAIEHMVAQYPKISDAISWAEEWEGHAFFVTYFPSGIGADGKSGAGAVLVYDLASGLWHERAYSNPKGYLEAAHMRNHFAAWGNHFVGDWASGNIYQLNFPQLSGQKWIFADDDGVAMKRVRVGPHLAMEDQFLPAADFVLDVETGLGPTPPLTGPYALPGIQNAIIVPDQNGNPFLLQITDEGDIKATATQGTIQTVIIEDSNTPQTAYQITYDSVNNRLAPVLSPWNLGYSQSFPMATISQLQSALFIKEGHIQVLGPVPAPRGPQVTLEFSKDGGRTWIEAGPRDTGQAGDYRRRVYWNRAVSGRTRVWTPRITYSDPAPLRIIDAFIPQLEPRPQRRTIQQFSQNA